MIKAIFSKLGIKLAIKQGDSEGLLTKQNNDKPLKVISDLDRIKMELG